MLFASQLCVVVIKTAVLLVPLHENAVRDDATIGVTKW